LGLIPKEKFQTTKRDNLKNPLIESIINLMRKESCLVLEKIGQSEFLKKYFDNGRDYAFYCCLSGQSVDLLAPFIAVLSSDDSLTNSVVSGQKFDKNFFETNKQKFQHQIENLADLNVKNTLFGALLKLCADFNDFLTLIALIVDNKINPEQFLNIKIHREFILNEILTKTAKKKIVLKELTPKYNRLKGHLIKFRSEILAHVILNYDDFEQSVSFIGEFIDCNLEEAIWLELIEIYVKQPLDLDQFLLLYDKLQPLGKKKIRLIFQSIHELISQDIKIINNNFNFWDDKKLKQIKNCLNSKLVFQWGCINLLKEISTNENQIIEFLIVQILVEQYDRCDENSWTNLTKKFFISLTLSLSDICIRTCMHILNIINAKQPVLSKELFRDLLQKFYTLDNSSNKISIFKMINFNANKNWEETYFDFVQARIIEPLKFKKSNELLAKCKEMLSNFEKIQFEHSKKEKLISMLLSVFECEPDLMRNELLNNPNRNNLSYKILAYAAHMPSLNEIKIVKSLKKISCSLANDLFNGNLFLNDVKELKNYENEKLKVFSECIRLSSLENIKLPTEKIQSQVLSSIAETDSAVNSLDCLKQFLDFLMKIDSKPIRYKPILEALHEKINSLNQIPIKEIKNILKNQHDLNDFAITYEKFKKSSSFLFIFKQAYNDMSIKEDEINQEKKNPVNEENKDIDENEENSNLKMIDMKRLLNIVDMSFIQLIENLDKKTTLKLDYLEKYFNNLTKIDEINSEIELINEKRKLNDTEFVRTSIVNLIDFKRLNNLFENLENSLKSFKMGSDDLIKNYLKLAANKKSKVVEYNDIVEKLKKTYGFFVELPADSEVIHTINEMGKSHKLIEFLLGKSEQELRNLIDSLDEHGDGYIRVQNIIELCKVTQFFQSLKLSNINDFIKSIENVLKEDKEKKFSNISAMIHASFSILDSIRLIIDTFQNREEASKIKIIEIATNSEFNLKFSNDAFSLTTLFRGKKVLSLNDLFDLRDRALLMTHNQMNSAENFQNIGKENIKELKCLYDNFIKSVELLNSIVNYMNQSYINGYPIDEFYPIISLKIKNKNFNEILEFERTVSDECSKWQKDLVELQKKYNILNYFWGRHFILLVKHLSTKSDMPRLKEHLNFINANITELKDENFPPFPIVKSASPIEKVELLGKYLTELFSKVSAHKKIQISQCDQTKNEVIILIKTDHYRYYLNAMLLCYRDNDKCFPISNQVLFCNSSTTWQELRSFLFRLVNNEHKVLHALIGPERLEFENQDLFLKNFQKLAQIIGNRFIKLALISYENGCHIYSILSNSYIPGVRVEKYQNNKEVINFSVAQGLIQKWQTCQTIVTSKYSGLGKSTLIRKKSKQSHLITHSISNSENFQSLSENFYQVMKRNRMHHSVSLHLDIFSSNNDQTLNEFLFMLIFFRIVKVRGYMLTTYKVNHFYIEIANSFQESLLDRIYVGLLCEKIHIDEFDIDEFIIEQPACLEQPTQVVCNYLISLETNRINVTDLNKENMTILSATECSKLLKKYFSNTYANNLQISFTQLNNFINLLCYYLLKFGEIPYFLTSSLEFITEKLLDADLKKFFLEVREKMVKTLIKLARENAVNPIDTAKQTQNFAKQFINSEMNDEDFEKIGKDFSQYIDHHVVCFENCQYLMVLFSHDQSIQLIYSNRNILEKNIMALFKSQNSSHMTEIALREYVLNNNDTSLFPDYQNETHEAILDRIQSLANSTPDFSVFFKNQDDFTIGLNDNIQKTLNKLEYYRLTADNYLKMVLIFNKIKSSLPVVIMGETGCGKTSLIGYLALRVLNIKFITINIHAGVSQANFLLRMKQILKLKETLNEEMWLFFDEFNTSDCMYLIAEMICKKSLLGLPLPSDLKLLAACNPYKLRNKTLEIGLVLERKSSRLLHIVNPLPDSLLEHIWDYGALKPLDEKAYIRSIINACNFRRPDRVVDLLFMAHVFIRKIDLNSGSVSLRDIDRFRIFYSWFRETLNTRSSFASHYNYGYIEEEDRCIVLSMFISYYIRISKKSDRDEFVEKMSHILGLNTHLILKVYYDEQNEYLNRMNVPKGIAKNNALRENVFATFVCVMNKIPVFICGKPGCSKTLTIQLLLSNLHGIKSNDEWFKKLPDLFAVTYQGSESSTSEGILLVFEKAKNIVMAHQTENNPIIPLIVFDEMGLAEISKNNPLKVLHSLLEGNNLEMAFVGISNWRLDASKMNRGVFVARPDLTLDDLKDTAKVIFESYTQSKENREEYKFIECLAVGYHQYKQHLAKTAFPEFHGTRDFYYLIKQVSDKLSNKNYPSKNEILSIIETSLERNFQGLVKNVCNMKDEFFNCLEHNGIYPMMNAADNRFTSLDLIQMNLEEANSRYLMLITQNDSALFILDNFLNKHIKNRVTFIGSKFENDLNEEAYSFRKLSDIIMCMETGWTIIMQDMDDIYGSLYDLFNQNFTIIGENKKNCRIALGPVTNPMCLVNDNFHCIVVFQQDQLSKCEPPFLNRFEKYFLSFDSIIKQDQAQLIDSLNDWIKLLLIINDPKIKIKFDNVVLNFNNETIPSLVLFYANKAAELNIKDNQLEYIETNAKKSLIKTMSNFSLMLASQSEMQFVNENEVNAFYELYNESFVNASNLNDYLKNKLQESDKVGFKTIVYTFDSVVQELNLKLANNFVEIKIGVFRTEESVNKEINKYFLDQDKKILIIRLELSIHAKHLQLLMFLIEKLELDHKKKHPYNPKSVCLLIHIDFFADHDLLKSLNKYKMSFLSEWEHIMIDRLNDKFLLLNTLIHNNSHDLIRNENLVRFEDLFGDLVTNALNKFNYAADEKRIYSYRKHLMNLIFEKTNDNIKIRNMLIEWFKTNIWASQNIKSKKLSSFSST